MATATRTQEYIAGGSPGGGGRGGGLAPSAFPSGAGFAARPAGFSSPSIPRGATPTNAIAPGPRSANPTAFRPASPLPSQPQKTPLQPQTFRPETAPPAPAPPQSLPVMPPQIQPAPSFKEDRPRSAGRPDPVKFENPTQAPIPDPNYIPTVGGTVPNRLYSLIVSITEKYDVGGGTVTASRNLDLGFAFGQIGKAFAVGNVYGFDLRVLTDITPANPAGFVRGLGSYDTAPRGPGQYYYSNPRLNALHNGQVEAPEAPTLPSQIPDTIPQFLPPGLPDPVYPGEDNPTVPDYPPSLPRPELPEDDPPEPAPPAPTPEPPVTEPPPPEPEPEKPREQPAPRPGPPPEPETPGITPGQVPQIPGTPQQDVPEGTPFRSPFAPAQVPPAQPARPFPNTQNPAAPMPGQQPEIRPAQLPSTTPAPTPATTPATQPSTQPAPGTTPSTTPGTTPDIKPAQVPGTTPSTTPSTTPGTTPSQVPGHTPGQMPGQQPGQQPAQTPAQQPGQQPGQQPAQTPAPTPTPAPLQPTAPFPRSAENVTPTPTTLTPSTPPATTPTPGTTPDPITPFPQPPAPLPPANCPPGCTPKEEMDICNSPCIVDMRRKIANIDDKLDLLETLKDLLDALTAGQPTDPELPVEPPPLKFVPLSVPIVTCSSAGDSTTEMRVIQVIDGTQASTLEQFKALAEIHREQCQIEFTGDRTYRILGGSNWFEKPTERQPKISSKPERDLKRFAEAFGFPKLKAEDPQLATQEALLEKRTQQPAPGKVNFFSLPDMIQAYSSLLFHRAGLHGFPAEVPKTLLGYSDDEKGEELKDFASYFVWYVKQFDALVGKFPIEITIDDADLSKPGKQTKKIELPNISEALAELYGLNINTGTNTDLSVNMLARIAVETVAAKNAALIGQDYAKANASFLGYKGNTVKRSIQYAFNPKKFDTLDEFLANTWADIEGWEEQDPETVVGFLQRLVFAAGIIKSVYFRDKDLIKQFEKEAANLLGKDKNLDDARWLQFVQMLNNPASDFNRGDNPQPEADKEPDKDVKPKT